MFVTAESELAPLEDQGVILIASDSASNTSPEQLSRYTAALTKAYEAFDETDQTFLFNGSQGSGPATVRNKALSGIVLTPWRRTRPYADRDAAAGAGNGRPECRVEVRCVWSAADAGRRWRIAGTVCYWFYRLRRARSMRWRSSCWVRPGKVACLCFADLDMKYDRPQTDIRIDREKAANLGIDMEQLGNSAGRDVGWEVCESVQHAGAQLQSDSPGRTPIPPESRADWTVSRSRRVAVS